MSAELNLKRILGWTFTIGELKCSIGKPNIHFPEMIDGGTESNKNKGSKKN
jgi:hypothetical protein